MEDQKEKKLMWIIRFSDNLEVIMGQEVKQK